MSIRMMSLVWELTLPDSEKLVLLALADCANDEGLCWPSVATLARKCTKSERTVQGCIHSLEQRGHLTRDEVKGKGCKYIVHPIVMFGTPETAAPRRDCTGAEDSPPQPAQQPPQRLRPTPAAAAPKPSKNHKKSSPPKMRAIPDDWWPEEFAAGTESRKVVDGWPPGELPAQVEQFRAHHGSKNNTFSDPQKAWSTWVLNTRKWGVGRNERPNPDPIDRLVAAGFSNGRGAGEDRQAGGSGHDVSGGSTSVVSIGNRSPSGDQGG